VCENQLLLFCLSSNPKNFDLLPSYLVSPGLPPSRFIALALFAMSFKFSFSGDDIIDSDSEETQDVKTLDQTTKESGSDESNVPSQEMDGILPQHHTLESMVRLFDRFIHSTIRMMPTRSKYF